MMGAVMVWAGIKIEPSSRRVGGIAHAARSRSSKHEYERCLPYMLAVQPAVKMAAVAARSGISQRMTA